MKAVKRLADGKFICADELDNVAGVTRGETFFEFIDAVKVAVFGQTRDAIEVVTFEVVLGGVFNHVPLDGVLGVIIFHVLFVATTEEVDDLGAVEHEHGGG